MKIKTFLCVFLLIGSLQLTAQQHYQPDWSSIDSRPVPAWYTDAKFGIFIHWGVYSVPGWAPTGNEYQVYSKYAEWYWYRLIADTGKAGRAFREHHLKTYGPSFKYQDFAVSFKAELFNPDQWADLFVASGARYVVLTSKHHEGFTLWPSLQSWNWNSADIGPHRDLAGDLSTAVKAKGLHMGFYYSLYEWFNPLYKTDVNRYVTEHMIPQMKDLVTTYKPDILWTDGEWEHPSETWKSTEFLSWLYNESPVKEKVVVNDRWGKETRGHHGGFYTTEYDLINNENGKDKKMTHPWEECRGVGFSFGINRNENLNDYSSSADLIHLLIEKVAKGGNLLLDIGPNADGSIPVILQQRLTDIGNWLKINGEAIYGTTSWEQAPAAGDKSGVYFTKKGKDLFLLCTQFPKNEITLDGIRSIKNISLLGLSAPVKYSFKKGKLLIQPPVITPLNSPGNDAWVFKLGNVF